MPFGTIPRKFVVSDKERTRRYTKSAALSAKQKSQVKSIVTRASETKISTPTLNFSSGGLGVFITPPILAEMPLPAQGNTDGQRVGDRLMLKSLTFKTTFIVDPLAAVPGVITRLIIFQWHPSTSTGVPTASSILLTDPIGGVISVRSSYSWDNRSMFTILTDRTYSCVKDSNLASGYVTRDGYFQNTIVVRKFRKPVQYFAASSTLATNTIWVLGISDQAVRGTAAIMTGRLTYTDD